MASKPIYQCCAECEDFEPKIWHCFQVSNNVEIPKFGYIFMIMFVMLHHIYFKLKFLLVIVHIKVFIMIYLKIN